MLDTAISPMSMTYGHTATETVVSMVEGTDAIQVLPWITLRILRHIFAMYVKNTRI